MSEHDELIRVLHEERDRWGRHIYTTAAKALEAQATENARLAARVAELEAALDAVHVLADPLVTDPDGPLAQISRIAIDQSAATVLSGGEPADG